MNQTLRIPMRPARNADASAIVGFNRAMALEAENLELIGPTVSGVRGIRLYVEKSNAPAQNVYQSTGMRPSGYLMFEQEVTP